MARKKKEQPSDKRPADHPDDKLSLRVRAERRLDQIHPDRVGELTRAEVQKLVHELHTHQIELEMQNEELRDAHHQLEGSRRKYSSLFNFAPVGYLTFDTMLVVHEANYTLAKMLGRDLRELYGSPFLNTVAKPDRGAFMNHVNTVQRIYHRHTVEVGLKRKDGTVLPVAMESVRDEEDEQIIVRTAIIDITDRRKAERAIRQQADLLNLTHETIIMRDMEGTILFWNRGAEEMYGWFTQEAVGRKAHELLKTRFPEPLEKITGELLRANKWQGELVHRKKDGTEIVVASRWALRRNDGQLQRPVAVMEVNSDITHKKNMEDKIRFQAEHDTLTTLPNRRLFKDHLAKQISHAKRNNEKLGVLFLDLDRFKIINDSLGHSVGDRILQSVSDRLGESMRQSDIIARIGGDEFAVAVFGINHAEDVGRIAEKLGACFKEPFVLDGREFFLSSSMGISMYPEDGDHPDMLLKNADIAMYQAKQSGRNTYRFFDQEMNDRSVERMMLENHLRQMLNRGQLIVHYQPQVDARTGEITGAEALARWNHPEMGLLDPSRFIPVAEETGLILAIDEWMLKTACTQRKEWLKQGAGNLCITVNISAGQFHQPGLIETVSRVLNETGLDPRFLEIEITESIAMQDVEATLRNIEGLTALGVNLVIDDFGTGYSSLSYLRKLPIKKLKIDKSFVAGLPTDADSTAIVTAIVAMAHSMKLKVVAEGVETGEQRDMLKSLGCDELQGFAINKPMTTEEFTNLL